jgi:hypothetical protein
LNLNGTHQLLVCSDYANVLGGSVRACVLQWKTAALVDASKESGLAANAEKTKYMSVYPE